MEKFQKRLVKVTKEHNDECKQLLKLMGIPYVDVSTTEKINVEKDNVFFYPCVFTRSLVITCFDAVTLQQIHVFFSCENNLTLLLSSRPIMPRITG